MEVFATSHGKAVVDGIGGRAKFIVRNAGMSKGRSAAVVQNAKNFSNIDVRVEPPQKLDQASDL